MALPVGYAAWWNTRYAGKPAGRHDSEGYFPIKLTFHGRKRWLLAIGSFSRSCIDPEEAARMEALHKRMEVARRARTYNRAMTYNKVRAPTTVPADGETLTSEGAEA